MLPMRSAEVLELVAMLIENVSTPLDLSEFDHDLLFAIAANLDQLCTDSASSSLGELLGTRGEQHPAVIEVTAAEVVVAGELVDQVEQFTLSGVDLGSVCSLFFDQISEVAEGLLKVLTADGNESIIFVNGQLVRVFYCGQINSLLTSSCFVLLQVTKIFLEEVYCFDLHDFHSLA